MVIELLRRSIGVDVEAVSCEPGDRRPRQLAAERQHQPIIGEALAASVGCHDNMLFCEIDRLHLGDPVTHTDRIEKTGKRKRDIAEVDLVIAHADIVIGVAVEHQDLELCSARADLLTYARGADRGP